jgi:hypothetical protein
MLVTCPQCRKALNVPDTAAGQQGRCPMCQAVFTIAAPAPAPAPVVTPVVAAVAPQPGAFAPAVAVAGGGLTAGTRTPLKIIGLGGAFIMVVSFFLPWWGMNIASTVPKFDDPKERQLCEKEGKALLKILGAKENRDFYDKTFSAKDREDFAEGDEQDPKPGDVVKKSKSAFGWKFASGILSFVFGIIILGLMIPQLFVKFLQRWGWTGTLPGAAMALVVFIMGLVFWIGTPGEDLAGTMIRYNQGVSIGPFLAFAGGAIATAACTMDGLSGLFAFVRKK